MIHRRLVWEGLRSSRVQSLVGSPPRPPGMPSVEELRDVARGLRAAEPARALQPLRGPSRAADADGA